MGNSKNVLDPYGKSQIVNGKEVLSPVSLVEFAESGGDMLLERVRETLGSRRMARIAEDNGVETFEEANDFEIEEDFDQTFEDTPYMKDEYLVSPAREQDEGVGPVPDRAPPQKNKMTKSPSPEDETRGFSRAQTLARLEEAVGMTIEELRDALKLKD